MKKKIDFRKKGNDFKRQHLDQTVVYNADKSILNLKVCLKGFSLVWHSDFSKNATVDIDTCGANSGLHWISLDSSQKPSVYCKAEINKKYKQPCF